MTRTNKKTQKGGSLNTPSSVYTKALEYCDNKGLSSLKSLIEEVFDQKQKNFDMNVSLKDPFLQNNTTNPNYFVEWYNNKNPNWELTKEIKHVEMPEYKTLLAQIGRDCLIMILTGNKNLNNTYRSINNITEEYQTLMFDLAASQKQLENNSDNNDKKRQVKNYTKKLQPYEKFFSNNTLKNKSSNNLSHNNVLTKAKKHFLKAINNTSKKEFEELINHINICISSKYMYVNVLNIIFTFIYIISNTPHEYRTDIENNLENNIHILFPTYQTLNFQSVVLLTSAPIVNFRISNRIRKVHRSFVIPLRDCHHDLGHAEISHKYNKSYAQTFFSKRLIEEHIKKRQLLNEKIFTYYFCNDCTLKDDKKEYQDPGLITFENLSKQNQKNVYALILFSLLHEVPKIEFLNASIIESLIPRIKNENNFNKKYPFVDKLDWRSACENFYTIYKQIDDKIKSKNEQPEIEY